MQQSSCDYVANSEPKQVGQKVRNLVYRPVLFFIWSGSNTTVSIVITACGKNTLFIQ